MLAQSKPSESRKIAIVTGGNRGIGRNTVVSLAKRGVDSIFTFNAHREEAEAVAAEARAAGAQAVPLQLDAGKIASFDAFIKDVEKALSDLGQSRFDFLVNNAGNQHRNMPFEKATEEEFDSVLSVHFKGVFFLTQKLLPLMAEASAADEGWRAHCEPIDGADSHGLARRSDLRVDEGSGRSAVEASGKGVGTAEDCRQRRCPRPGGDGLQRWHRSRQSCSQQDDR